MSQNKQPSVTMQIIDGPFRPWADEPSMPTIAEYLAQRERALNWLAYWLAVGTDVAPEVLRYLGRSRVQQAMHLAWAAPKASQPPARNRTPLPLP